MLPPSELIHQLLVTGVDHQMKSAEPLDGDDLAITERLCRGEQRIIELAKIPPSIIQKSKAWPAFGACVRLCMKAAVRRIVILRPARLADPKLFHRRVRPIIRDRLDYRVARTAICAIRKRVPEPAVERVVDLTNAVRADSGIGQNYGDLGTAVFTRKYFEIAGPCRVEKCGFDALKIRQRRLLV